MDVASVETAAQQIAGLTAFAPPAGASPSSAQPPSSGVPSAPDLTDPVPAAPGQPSPTVPPVFPKEHAAGTIDDAVNKIFNAKPGPLQISYQTSTDPNEVIIVFRDPVTNQVVAQFPSEVLVRLAQFFNRVIGAVFDKQV
jgi:hypothetical protein